MITFDGIPGGSKTACSIYALTLFLMEITYNGGRAR